MWEWLISQCSSPARGCITVSLVSHEYFTVVFISFFFSFLRKKAQKHESSSPWIECSTFPEGKLSSVAFIETSLPSAKHHIPSVLFFPCPSHCYKVKWVKFQILLYCCIQYVDTVCTVYWMSACASLFVSLCILILSSDLGQSIFYTTTCLLPFLSDDILSTLPYTMISTLATFPPFLHKDIIEYLSTSFLPMAIREYPPYLLPKQVLGP